MRVDPFCVKAKPSRRLFLKTMGIAAGVILSSGIMMPSAQARNNGEADHMGGVDSTTVNTPTIGKKPWAFPDHAEITRMMNDPHYVGGDPIWRERAMWLVNSLWPAMAVVASQRGEPLSEALYHEMMSVSGMERFVSQNRGLQEADAVGKYLTRLPGYQWQKLDEGTELQNGWLVMQTSHVISLSKEAVA